MSLIPQVHVTALEDMFAPHEVAVEVSHLGVLLKREADGLAYRISPTDDGYARGTALERACRVFGIDQYDLIYG